MKSAFVLALPLVLLLFSYARGDTFGSGANTFDIQFVTIGNPGNAADTTGNPNPAGSVPYDFRMGKFEISEQMIENANVLGNLGITQISRGLSKPATDVSWNEAARFVNWLNTSVGSTPAYKFARQPGESGYDANENIQLWTSSDAGYDANNLYRNSLARYVLPSVHEWYKAAFYDPIRGIYYNYPTGSDIAPTPVASGTVFGTAVYGGQAGPADIMLAGGPSHYGTIGQGGNAHEWGETDLDLLNNSSSSLRGARGGYWNHNSSILISADRSGGFPHREFSGQGFRVASSIPEPSSLVLVGFAALACDCVRRRRKSAVGLARSRQISDCERWALRPFGPPCHRLAAGIM